MNPIILDIGQGLFDLVNAIRESFRIVSHTKLDFIHQNIF